MILGVTVCRGVPAALPAVAAAAGLLLAAFGGAVCLGRPGTGLQRVSS